jgi:hypothetical protein
MWREEQPYGVQRVPLHGMQMDCHVLQLHEQIFGLTFFSKLYIQICA